MAYQLQSALHLSLDNVTWYKLTDHNREPLNISVELIESQSRMANGTMRKYVVAKKNTISASWKYVPSRTDVRLDNGTIVEYLTADHNLSAGWLEWFYQANAGLPIYLKVIMSEYGSEPVINTVPTESNKNFKTSAELPALNNIVSVSKPAENVYTTSQEDAALLALSTLEQSDTTNSVRGSTTGSRTYRVFMSNFSKTIINRTKLSDYVDMSIDFTEI